MYLKNKKTTILLVVLIPIISLIVGIATLSHYGINWDEPYHYRRGQAFLNYLLTGKKDYSNLAKYPALKGDSDNPNFRNGQKYFKENQKNQQLLNSKSRRSFYQDDSWDGNYFIDEEGTYGHPALNDVLAALSNKIFYQKLGVIGDLESYRLFIVLAVSLTGLSMAIFIWKEFGIIESIISSLSFAIFPLILGEQHFNIKDPVETSFYTLTILTAYLGIKKNKLRWLILSVLSFSIALSTKFNIIFALVPLVLWFIFFSKKITKNILIAFTVSPIIIFGVLILSYPTLWKNIIFGLQEILRFYREAGYPGTNKSFFNTYPIVWILYTTPPIIIGTFVLSILFVKKMIQKNSFVFLLFIWLATVITRNALFGALSYGGVRLIMEFIPALCMLSGVTVGFVIKKYANKYQAIFILLTVLCFTPTIYKLVKIHPNENVYFNFLIGGLAGAKKINLPSWGDSYGNAYYPGITWLNQNAEPNARVSIPIGVTSNIPRFKLRNDIAVSPYYWSGLSHSGEYLIELTYDYPPMNYFALKYLNEAMIPVYEIKVDGVSIAKVWKNDSAHVKPEFTKEKQITAKIISDIKNKTLRIEIPMVQKAMKIKINQPTKNCTSIKTGYLSTSIDGNSWTREVEDISSDQLNREETKGMSTLYEYYLVARNAKIFIFNTDSSNNCLLRANRAEITILSD